MSKFQRDLNEIVGFVKRYVSQSEAETAAREREKEGEWDIELVEFKPNGHPAHPFVCVDGSYADLLYLREIDANITLFRISTVAYEFGDNGLPVLTSHKVFDKLALISTNNALFPETSPLKAMIPIAQRFEGRGLSIMTNLMMNLLEQYAILAAAKKFKQVILARDGSLTLFFLPELEMLVEETIEACELNQNIFVGISKDSTSHYLDEPLVDEAALFAKYGNISKQLAAKIPKAVIGRHHRFKVAGDIYFARLYANAEKFFRVDLATMRDQPAEALGQVSQYCQWQGVPGFPFPLVEAHKSAKSVRDMREEYVKSVMDACLQAGIPRDIVIKSMIDRYGVVSGRFHTTLDLMSKL